MKKKTSIKILILALNVLLLIFLSNCKTSEVLNDKNKLKEENKNQNIEINTKKKETVRYDTIPEYKEDIKRLDEMELARDSVENSIRNAEKECLETGNSSFELDGQFYSLTRVDNVSTLINKVFPGVKFFYSQTMFSSLKHLGAYYQGEGVNFLLNFNELFDLMEHEFLITLEDKILVFIMLYEDTIDPPEIKSIEKISIKDKLVPYLLNYKVTVLYTHALNKNQYPKTYYLHIDNEKIKCITELNNAGFFVRTIYPK